MRLIAPLDIGRVLLASALTAGLLVPTAILAAETPAERGYRWLTTKTYLTPDFDQEVFDHLWEVWPEPLRSEAEKASPAERRLLAFARYGLDEAPERQGGPALQYVDNGRGGWVMNCLACHTGQVDGQMIFGAPNTRYDLQTLTEEVRSLKPKLNKPFTHMDKGSFLYPLGGSVGTTNAVMFGKILLSYRDVDLNFRADHLPFGDLMHHDHDAPAWWNVKRKAHLYSDGFAPKSHRALMQFLLIPRNGPDKFRAWEEEYRDILAWIEGLEPPKYPRSIDSVLANQGRLLFEQNCRGCHGTTGPDGNYPEKIIPIDVVGTDRTRFDALGPEGRSGYAQSWLAATSEHKTIETPSGYVAPPLDGIWASAPYFHNGSAPTLWHVLHSAERPTIWRRTSDAYDHNRIGVSVEVVNEVPSDIADPHERRLYFDTRVRGKSAAGHTFPDRLTDTEKRAVLEYLKTF